MPWKQPFLSVDDVAERFQISRTTTYGLLLAGKLRAYKVAGQWRISEEQIETYLRSVENKPSEGIKPYRSRILNARPDGRPERRI
jgi:excisionase family DNA binding protein